MIKQSLFEIRIKQKEEGYYLTIHQLKSPKQYPSLDAAKVAAFDVIESGKLYEYLDKKGIRYRKKKDF